MRNPDGTWDKSKLPSRRVTEGPERAPHRSYYYAMGLGSREIAQPFVGVASCWNQAAPCNTALMRQANAAAEGVKAAGATPREFCTITVTDGIAMGHAGMYASLPSREVIADSVELTVRGHAYDALVGVAGCDKSLPGMMMAMLRLNVPSVFLYGGSILPGRWRGKDVTVQAVFEAVGQHAAGKLDFEDLCDLERHACPGVGVARLVGRRQRRGQRRGGGRPDREGYPSARHLHAGGVRERRRGRGGDRRLDQRRPASAGHGQ